MSVDGILLVKTKNHGFRSNLALQSICLKPSIAIDFEQKFITMVLFLSNLINLLE